MPLIYEGENPEIAGLWKEAGIDTIKEITALSNVEPKGLLSVCTNFSEDRSQKGELDYYLAAATTNETPEKFEDLEVPALTWAVFESIGPYPETLQNVWGRIYSEWFPTSSYEHVKGPEILWNADDDIKSDKFHSEIWIPVQAK